MRGRGEGREEKGEGRGYGERKWCRVSEGRGGESGEDGSKETGTM